MDGLAQFLGRKIGRQVQFVVVQMVETLPSGLASGCEDQLVLQQNDVYIMRLCKKSSSS